MHTHKVRIHRDSNIRDLFCSRNFAAVPDLWVMDEKPMRCITTLKTKVPERPSRGHTLPESQDPLGSSKPQIAPWQQTVLRGCREGAYPVLRWDAESTLQEDTGLPCEPVYLQPPNPAIHWPPVCTGRQDQVQCHPQLLFGRQTITLGMNYYTLLGKYEPTMYSLSLSSYSSEFICRN